MQNIYWNESLIRKYDLQGPRYTSYPTAVEFSEPFCPADLQQAATKSHSANRPLSLYFHIPFCAKLCYYCACNKIVTKRKEKALPYLQDVFKEMALQVALFGSGREVHQLHWGGGTPTFLSSDEMRLLMQETRKHFTLLSDDQGDYSIEIDPREVAPDTLATLRELGFNRVSLGVQDFNPRVQKAVNRIQSPELTLRVLEEARRLGFRSINVDLIYGLPHQTLSTFRETVDTIIRFSPDRMSVFNYAHLPQRFMPQQRILEQDLPRPETKLEILHNSIGQLIDAGYHFIGMDHFAKPDDTLAVAQAQGKLHRNFQGYTTHGNCDLMAFGVSSISMMDRHYYQNRLDSESYGESLARGELPIFRGVSLTQDDVIRREIISQLICQFTLQFPEIERGFGINFRDYFKSELLALESMVEDGLVQLKQDSLQINPPGRLLIRAICKLFDIYRLQSEQNRFSRII
ncbi:MAG: oxygen-independent coproporphyrinogen III oxidase [Hahellaceae bacterium]|nr:oxygen-independent coproporphyrinogen III oxidase [Hahellaceae bacterium]